MNNLIIITIAVLLGAALSLGALYYLAPATQSYEAKIEADRIMAGLKTIEIANQIRYQAVGTWVTLPGSVSTEAAVQKLKDEDYLKSDPLLIPNLRLVDDGLKYLVPATTKNRDLVCLAINQAAGWTDTNLNAVNLRQFPASLTDYQSGDIGPVCSDTGNTIFPCCTE